MDPISTARYGMMAASRQLAASAGRVANLAADPVDYATEAVTQIEAKQAFSANAHVIRIADEMWRALLDVQKDR